MRVLKPALVIISGLIFGAGAQPAWAQTADSVSTISDVEINLMRRDLRDQKKQIVAANLPLNGDEATKFWPVYDAYTKDTIKVNDDRYRLLKEYAANYRTMTDDAAASFVRSWISVDEAAIKLRLNWISKFAAAVGEKKSAMFFQIDRRIGLMQELQLASQVPLIQP